MNRKVAKSLFGSPTRTLEELEYAISAAEAFGARQRVCQLRRLLHHIEHVQSVTELADKVGVSRKRVCEIAKYAWNMAVRCARERDDAVPMKHLMALCPGSPLHKALAKYPRPRRTLKKQIPMDDLLEGRWYVGRGRNANVALWASIGPRLTFLTIASKFGQMVIKDEGYYHEDPQCGGCFQPFALIEEGSVAEPVGPDNRGWSAHYAKQLRL